MEGMGVQALQMLRVSSSLLSFPAPLPALAQGLDEMHFSFRSLHYPIMIILNMQLFCPFHGSPFLPVVLAQII